MRDVFKNVSAVFLLCCRHFDPVEQEVKQSTLTVKMAQTKICNT